MFQAFKKFFIGGFAEMYEIFVRPFIHLYYFLIHLSFYKKCFLLILTGILLYIPFIDTINANHDEQYTTLLCRHYNIIDLIKLIIFEDGHPPLSYLYAKFWIWLFVKPEYNILALHVGTFFCFLLTSLLGVFPIRRLLGEKTALIWICLLFVMPSACNLINNMRMYPLAMFLITAIFIYGMLLIYKPHKYDWFLFALFSLLSIYTHYYCAILCSVIWLIVLIEILRSKQYRNLVPFCISGAIVALLFSPWLFAFYTQYQNMKDVWYPSMQGAYDALSGMFFQYNGGSTSYTCLCIFFGSLCQVLVFEYMTGAQKNLLKRHTAKYALIVFWSIYLIAFVLSIALRPTISIRFLVIQTGIFYIGLALALVYIKKYRWIFICLLSVIFFKNYSLMYNYVHHQAYKEMKTYIENEIPQNSLILYSTTNAQFIITMYRPELDAYLAPRFSYLALLQDRVSREKVRDLNSYDAIYYFLTEPYYGQCTKGFFTIYGNYCLHKLTKEEAERELKASWLYREGSFNRTLLKNGKIDLK